jgi:hypothetical protein
VGRNAVFGDLVIAMKRTQHVITFLALCAALFVSTPASAQADLVGNWIGRLHEDWQDRSPGPDVVDYLGMPLNDEGRAKALSYSTSVLSQPERQCLYYPPHYVVLGPQGLRIWAETDPIRGEVVAWKLSAAVDRPIITIWMDGRPHPPEGAAHPFAGFTTGKWEGTTLVSYTTHVKAGYFRRNGAPSSDKATLTMYLSRHGDTLTITAIFEDPIYLSEPQIMSRSWQLESVGNPTSPVPGPCVPEAEVATLDGGGAVPHYLPGENPFVNDISKLYNIPVEAVLGGAETMYPEYRKKLQSTYKAPEKCTRYCCGWSGAAGSTAPGLQCITGGDPAILNER